MKQIQKILPVLLIDEINIYRSQLFFSVNSVFSVAN